MIKWGETNFRESDWFDVDDIHGVRIVAGVTVKIPAETLSAGGYLDTRVTWKSVRSRTGLLVFFVEHALRPAFQQMCLGRLVWRAGLLCESIKIVGVSVRVLVFGSGKNSPNRRKRLSRTMNHLVVLATRVTEKNCSMQYLTVPGSCSKASTTPWHSSRLGSRSKRARGSLSARV